MVLGRMPLTPCLFTNTSLIPVGATKANASFSTHQRRFRLVARTHASHAWNTGSIPVGATSVRTFSGSNFFVCQLTMLAFRTPRGATVAGASRDCLLQALSIISLRLVNSRRRYFG